jgi:hypothetical protein
MISVSTASTMGVVQLLPVAQEATAVVLYTHQSGWVTVITGINS